MNIYKITHTLSSKKEPWCYGGWRVGSPWKLPEEIGSKEQSRKHSASEGALQPALQWTGWAASMRREREHKEAGSETGPAWADRSQVHSIEGLRSVSKPLSQGGHTIRLELCKAYLEDRWEGAGNAWSGSSLQGRGWEVEPEPTQGCLV